MINPPEICKKRSCSEHPIPFSIPYRMWLEMLLPALMIITYPSHSLLQTVLDSLKTSVSKVFLGLYFFIMKLCLQHHLSTVRGTQRCLGYKLRKVSRCGRRKALTPIRYACNLPSSSNKKNWYIWEKEALIGVRVISPAGQEICILILILILLLYECYTSQILKSHSHEKKTF